MPPKKQVAESPEVKEPKTSSTKSSVNSHPNLDSKMFSVNNTKLMKVFEKMTKTIESLSKVQDEFNTNYDALSNFKNEELTELDYQLKLKNEECYNHLQDLTRSYNEKRYTLDTEYKQKEYDLQQHHQQLLDELERAYDNKDSEKAIELLESCDYKIVAAREYEQLETQLKESVSGREEFEKRVTSDMHKELNARLKTQELEHKVLTSDMKAKIDNQSREINTLLQTIESLKAEIQAQRELTREVAQAGQKSVTQNFSK